VGIDPGASRQRPRCWEQPIRLVRADHHTASDASTHDLDGAANRQQRTADVRDSRGRYMSHDPSVRPGPKSNREVRRSQSLKNRSRSVVRLELLLVADAVAHAWYGDDQALQVATRIGCHELASDGRDVNVEIVALVHVLVSPDGAE
jgi:hypothetical protein